MLALALKRKVSISIIYVNAIVALALTMLWQKQQAEISLLFLV